MAATIASDLTLERTSTLRAKTIKTARRMSNALVPSTGNVVRTLSFGRRPLSFARRPKQQSPRSEHVHAAIREVSIFKHDGDDSLGLTLVKPVVNGAPEGEGVLIASVVPGSIAAKTKRIHAGDWLCAVNGTRASDYKHAADLLRAARGVCQLVLATSEGLPDGWEAHTDRAGVVYYRHAALQLRSYAHPAALNIVKGGSGSPESPVKKRRPSLGDDAESSGALSRWHAAFHTVALVNSLAGETETIDALLDAGAEEAALHARRGGATGASGKAFALLSERV